MSIESGDFEQFCRAEYSAVYKTTFVFCGNREMALEATQEAFARAFARWARLRHHNWAAGWVMTTALNTCRRALRKRNWPVPPDQELAVADTDLRLDILEILRTLPLRQRQAVLLHYIADLPVAAVAELMEASEGTVKVHLLRARRTLSDTLSPLMKGGSG